MKQATRAAAVLLGIVILSAPVSAATQDAYSVYQRGMKKMESVTSMEAQMDIVSTIRSGDFTIEITGEAVVRQVMPSKDRVEMEMIMKSEIGGAEIESTLYYKDGMLYQNNMGQKTKCAMDLGQAMAMSYSLDGSFTRDLLKNATVKEVENGTSISFTLDADAIDDAMQEALSAAYGSMGLTGMKLNLDDVRYTVVFGSDNMMKNYSMVYGATLDYEGMSMKIGYTINSEVISTNKIAKIAFPADLSQYEDITPPAASSKYSGDAAAI